MYKARVVVMSNLERESDVCTTLLCVLHTPCNVLLIVHDIKFVYILLYNYYYKNKLLLMQHSTKSTNW